MSSPLDGNGVLEPCPFCGAPGDELMLFCDPAEGRDNSGPSRRIQCAGCNIEAPFYDTETEAIAAWNARAPAPSQTAVEPVAYMDSAGLPSPPVRFHKDMRDNPGKYGLTPLVPLSTLTAQAAARVAAEKERDAARTDYEAATQSHLDHVLDLDIEMNGDGAAKRPLLIDIKGQLLEFIARAETAETEVATLKGRVAELEAGLEAIAPMLVYSFEDEPETIHVKFDGQTLAKLDFDSAEATAALKLEQCLARARRLTPEEKSNGR